MNEIYIAKWDDSKWLMLSSCLFAIPAGFAFYNKLYAYSSLLVLTSLVSANYWRKATYSWRRNMDLVLARISFSTFVFTGVLHVRHLPSMITGYTGLFVLIYSYNLSGKLWKADNPHWYKYHVLFHVLMMCEQLLILESVVVYMRSAEIKNV